MIYAIGRNPVIEALRSETKVDKVFIQSGINQDEKISEALNLASQKNINIEMVQTYDLEAIAGEEPHQGIIAETQLIPKKLSQKEIEADSGLYIFIREAQYEYNLGAIIRTAEVAGAKGIIIPPNQDLTSTAARISMGAAFHIPIYQYSLFPAIKLFKKAAYQIAGIERGGDQLFTTELSDWLLLIIGGEDFSLSEEVLSKCDTTLSIPQNGQVNSLNMSVAASIAIFEYVRQQG